jgi:hypothetical protein
VSSHGMSCQPMSTRLPPGRPRDHRWDPADAVGRAPLHSPPARSATRRSTAIPPAPNAPPACTRVSTRAAYRSNLEHHLLPYFGQLPLEAILPSTVQAWITHALDRGLSPRSVRKYHTLLHGIFARAVRDRVITADPAAQTELPKVITKRMHVLTPAEFDRLLANMPSQHQLRVLAAAESGVRWGELVALRPHHLDLPTRSLTVQDIYIEVSKKNSPTRRRMILRHYPKTTNPDCASPPNSPSSSAHGSMPRQSQPTDCSSPTRPANPSPDPPSAPASGSPPSPRPGSTSTYAGTTSATPTPPGSGRRRRPQDRHGPPRPQPDLHHPALPTHAAQHQRRSAGRARPSAKSK